MPTKDPTLVYVLWAGLGALATLLGLVFRAIVKGDLVPKATLDRAHEEGDKWEKAWHTSQQTLQETVHQGMNDLGAQLGANTEGLRLVERMVDALVARGPSR